jgi:hypothetical protein
MSCGQLGQFGDDGLSVAGLQVGLTETFQRAQTLLFQPAGDAVPEPVVHYVGH